MFCIGDQEDAAEQSPELVPMSMECKIEFTHETLVAQIPDIAQ